MNKTAILLIILAIILVAYILFNSRKKSSSAEEEHHDVEGGCCGKHAVCEKNNDKESLYFDDEELDAYQGRRPEEYTDQEIEEFRNVLYTMKNDEVDVWVQCLQQRGIELPEEIKDEVLLILQ
ncbi:MAG: phospholipase [Bacteroidaceae bacterium]|nr:phospholipase [Bacteroidaceae bacterium]